MRGREDGQQLELRQDDCVNSITTVQKDNMVLVRQATKQGFIPCEAGGVVDLNYPDSTTRRGRVQDNGKVCPTLTTENIPSVIEEWMWRGDGRGIYEARWRKVLSILWETVDEEEISEWAIRGLWCVLQKEVLRQNVYAESLYKKWREQSDIFQCTHYSEIDKQSNPSEERVRNLWEEWKARCASYRSKLEKQYNEQFDAVMSELSYEGTSSQSCLQSMWETYEGEGVLRKALSEIQKIWESDGSEEAEWYLIRIRKLTARECWRLMGFTDQDFEKAEKVCSNTQLYKQAGNSIVVPVIESIFRQMIKE